MSKVLRECIERGYNVNVRYEGREVTVSWRIIYVDPGSHMHVDIDDFMNNSDEYYRHILRYDDNKKANKYVSRNGEDL